MMDKFRKISPALICLPYGQSGPQTCNLKELVYTIIFYIEQLIVVIFAASLLMFLWGVFKYTILSQGDEKQTGEAKNVIFYGIIGLFVMASVWGILKIIQTSFFGA
jgi:hypothetical protein